MKRDIYISLVAWKDNPDRKPLILQGARQVGKTFILDVFARHEFANYIYLNFESDPQIHSFFKASLSPDKVVEKIQAYTTQKITPGKTLIIFDEIQECEEALNSLKYFCEDMRSLHVVAAGSLLGIKLARTKGFPVGKVDFINMYPLSFYEFLDAIGKGTLREYLENISEIAPLLDPFHNELMQLLKKYMYIGGMPEVVAKYASTGDILQIREVQEAILRSYDLDFAKHAPKEELMKISQIWKSIPRQLAKENSKFIFSVIRQGARGREYENALEWLEAAGLIIKAYNLSTPKLPLPAYGDTNAFKVFMLDIGLLSAMAEVPVKNVVMDDALIKEYNGAITENYVAQTITAHQKRLYYWTSAGIAEVDFIISYDGVLYPLEVKSGASLRKKSLMVYAQKFEPKLLLRTSTMNFKLDGNLCNFPLYLIARYAAFL